MGRVKSTAIKTMARDLIEEHGKKFSTEFGKNKKVLAEVKPIESKRVRNILAGQIVNEMKKIKQSGV
ncbi:MAG: 30S ribosomal protein S17e [Candidatus Aenigmarchaeota archaeon]